MTPKKILVVDDEPGIRETIDALLKPRGYVVILAADGEEGLQKIKSEKPDLVLLDIMMPKADGWQVLKAIRDNEATRELPVIMLTAKAETSSIMESKFEKATDYFIKPFSADELLRFVRRYTQ